MPAAVGGGRSEASLRSRIVTRGSCYREEMKTTGKVGTPTFRDKYRAQGKFRPPQYNMFTRKLGTPHRGPRGNTWPWPNNNRNCSATFAVGRADPADLQAARGLGAHKTSKSRARMRAAYRSARYHIPTVAV
eukprot:3917346-Pyramimonas_sp.AAC.1